jgi:hypothetical protein
MNYSSLSDICTEVIEESWQGNVPIRPSRKDGLQPSVETRDNLSIKNNKIGFSQNDQYNQSIGSGQNPYEQEESKTIDQNKVINIIDDYISGLDSKNNNDRLALTILGKLKKQIKRL